MSEYPYPDPPSTVSPDATRAFAQRVINGWRADAIQTVQAALNQWDFANKKAAVYNLEQKPFPADMCVTPQPDGLG